MRAALRSVDRSSFAGSHHRRWNGARVGQPCREVSPVLRPPAVHLGHPVRDVVEEVLQRLRPSS